MFKYFDEEPVLKPQHIVKPREGFPRCAIVTWQSSFLRCAQKYGLKGLFTYVGGITQPVYEIEYKGNKYAFAVIGMGGPNAASFIEEMTVMGTRDFVFMGSCGVIDKTIPTGLIVPDRAFRDEGTSWHYSPSKEEVLNIDTAAYTADFLTRAGIPFAKGATWTTDASYRETPSAVAYYRDRGCVCVEMECASVMAVAKYLGVKAYQIIFTADSLHGDKWEKGRLLGMADNAWEAYFLTALGLAESLNNKNMNVLKN